MKAKLSAIIMVIFLVPGFVRAGGLMTNTNQSASYIRMPVQDAIIGPEGVYYNPAGLAFLKDGLHLSVSNQTIMQNRTINSTYAPLARKEFEGTVSAPLFPSVYATYKKDRFAVSFGFNPIGGGGSALFEDGLPSFEQQVAVLPGMLTAGGIPTTQYSFETNFDAQSVFYGVQANVSYRLNDMISVSAGLRYVTASNSYEGYLREIKVNPVFPLLGLNGSTMIPASGFFGSLAGLFGQVAGIAGSLQPIVAGGGGGLNLSQAVGLGLLTPDQALAISGGFALVNPNINPATLTIAQIQGAYQAATPTLQAMRNQMLASQAMTTDKKVNTEQRGASLAPVVGVNLKFSERVNVAVKYEHKTPLVVKNETAVDDLGVYPDGLEISNNLPSLLSIGGLFGLSDRIRLSTGIHYYFDKSASYGKIKEWTAQGPVFYENKDIIDKNFLEAGLGVEFDVLRFLTVSAGYLRTQTGVNELYQSDISHSLSTNSIGGGLRVQITNALSVDAGALITQYEPYTKQIANFSETYNRSNMVFAVGLNLSF